MPNLILIPCWQRADFLAVTLDHICNAEGAADHLYVFLVDRGYDPEVLTVIRAFPYTKMTRFMPEHPHHGNTANVMEGYALAERLAERNGSDLVYLLEEDIFIAQDFFRFHELAHRTCPEAFCVSACRDQNREHAEIREHVGVQEVAVPEGGAVPEAGTVQEASVTEDADVTNEASATNEAAVLYRSHRYQSLGVSFKARELHYITRGAVDAYYSDPVEWCAGEFPYSSLPRENAEQDGYIDRICEAYALDVLYPAVPRAYHAGYTGYHRPARDLTGSLHDRIAALHAMTESEMNERAQAHKDITACDLAGHDVAQLVAVY